MPALLSTSGLVCGLVQGTHRILDYTLELVDEAPAESPVNDTVIAGKRHLHDPGDLERIIIVDDNGLGHLTDGKNRRARRVDDGGELLHTKGAEVADGEGCPGVLVRLQLAFAGFLDERFQLSVDVHNPPVCAVANDWGNKAVAKIHGQADVN